MSRLPQGWAEAQIADIAQKLEYGLTTKAELDAGGPKLLRITDIQDGAVDWNSVPRCRSADRNRYSLQKDDIVFARTGATTGKSFIIPDDVEDAVFASYLIKLRLESIYCAKYVYLFFKTREYWEKIKEVSAGVAQPGVNASKLAKLALPLPPLFEQRRIVAKLDSLFARTKAAREELARIPLLVEHYRQAILEKAFTGGLTADWRASGTKSACSSVDVQQYERDALASRARLRGSRRILGEAGNPSTTLGPLPEGWHYGRLIDLVDLKVGFAFKSSWFQDDGVPLIRGANVAPGRLDWADTVYLSPARMSEFLEYIVQPGDILLAMDRPLISTGLKVARASKDEAPALLVQRVARLRPTEWATAEYVWWILNSPIFINHAIERATGSDLPHISGNDIGLTPVPVPPLEEQKEIVRLLQDALDSIGLTLREACKATHLLDHLDQGLLAKAFRGELVPQDPSDEPAEQLLARIRAARGAPGKPRRGRRKKEVIDA